MSQEKPPHKRIEHKPGQETEAFPKEELQQLIEKKKHHIASLYEGIVPLLTPEYKIRFDYAKGAVLEVIERLLEARAQEFNQTEVRRILTELSDREAEYKAFESVTSPAPTEVQKKKDKSTLSLRSLSDEAKSKIDTARGVVSIEKDFDPQSVIYQTKMLLEDVDVYVALAEADNDDVSRLRAQIQKSANEILILASQFKKSNAADKELLSAALPEELSMLKRVVTHDLPEVVQTNLKQRSSPKVSDISTTIEQDIDKIFDKNISAATDAREINEIRASEYRRFIERHNVHYRYLDSAVRQLEGSLTNGEKRTIYGAKDLYAKLVDDVVMLLKKKVPLEETPKLLLSRMEASKIGVDTLLSKYETETKMWNAKLPYTYPDIPETATNDLVEDSTTTATKDDVNRLTSLPANDISDAIPGMVKKKDTTNTSDSESVENNVRRQEKLSAFLSDAESKYDSLTAKFSAVKESMNIRENDLTEQALAMMGDLIEDLRVVEKDGVADIDVPTSLLRRIREAQKTLLGVLPLNIKTVNKSKTLKENEDAEEKWIDSTDYDAKAEYVRHAGKRSNNSSDLKRAVESSDVQKAIADSPIQGTEVKAAIEKPTPVFEKVDITDALVKQIQERIRKIAAHGSERGVAGEVIGESFDPVAQLLNESLTKRLRYMKAEDAKIAAEKIRDFTHHLGEAKSTVMTMQNSGAVMDSVANLAQEARSINTYLDSHTAQEEVSQHEADKSPTLEELAIPAKPGGPETKAEIKAMNKDALAKAIKAFTIGDLTRELSLTESPEKKAMDAAEKKFLDADKEFHKQGYLVRKLKSTLNTQKVRELKELREAFHNTQHDYQAVIVERRKLAEANSKPTPEFTERSKKKYETLEKTGKVPLYLNGKPATFEEFLAVEQVKRVEALGKRLAFREVVRLHALRRDEGRVEALGEKGPPMYKKILGTMARWDRKGEDAMGKTKWKAAKILGIPTLLAGVSSAVGVTSMSAVLGFATFRIARAIGATILGAFGGNIGGKVGEDRGRRIQGESRASLKDIGKGYEPGAEEDLNAAGEEWMKLIKNSRESTVQERKAIGTVIGGVIGGGAAYGGLTALSGLTDTVCNLPTVQQAFGIGHSGSGLHDLGNSTIDSSHASASTEVLPTLHDHDYTLKIDGKINDADKLLGHFSKHLQESFKPGQPIPPSVEKFLALGGTGSHLVHEDMVTKLFNFQDNQSMSAMMHPGDSLSLEGDNIVFHSKFYGNTSHVLFDKDGLHPVVLNSMHPTPHVEHVARVATNPTSPVQVSASHAINNEVVTVNPPETPTTFGPSAPVDQTARTVATDTMTPRNDASPYAMLQPLPLEFKNPVEGIEIKPTVPHIDQIDRVSTVSPAITLDLPIRTFHTPVTIQSDIPLHSPQVDYNLHTEQIPTDSIQEPAHTIIPNPGETLSALEIFKNSHNVLIDPKVPHLYTWRVPGTKLDYPVLFGSDDLTRSAMADQLISNNKALPGVLTTYSDPITKVVTLQQHALSKYGTVATPISNVVFESNGQNLPIPDPKDFIKINKI